MGSSRERWESQQVVPLGQFGGSSQRHTVRHVASHLSCVRECDTVLGDRLNICTGHACPHSPNADDGFVFLAPVDAFGPQNAFVVRGSYRNIVVLFRVCVCA
jgi:hypothetical protein